MALKAWWVYGKDQHVMDDIIFAQTRGQAIAKSELLAESGEWALCRAKRVPWADQYAQAGKIPAQAYLDHDWSILCDRCDNNEVWELTDGKALCEDCLEAMKDEEEDE